MEMRDLEGKKSTAGSESITSPAVDLHNRRVKAKRHLVDPPTLVVISALCGVLYSALGTGAAFG